MKNKKTILIIGIIILLLGTITFIYNKTEEQTEAEKFKEEYEELNNKTYEENGKTKTYINLEIDKKNPIIYINTNDLLKNLTSENKLIYIGAPKDNQVRLSVPILLKAANDTGIPAIYYYNYENILSEENKNLYQKVLKEINKNESKQITTLEQPILILIKDNKVTSIQNGILKNYSNEEEKNNLYQIYENMMIDLIMCTSEC